MSIPRPALVVTATLTLMASITPAHGVFKTWTPLPGNPLFEQSNNWSPTGVPNDADSLIFLDLGVPIADVQFFGNQTVDGVDVRGGFYDFDITIGFGDTFSITGAPFPSLDIGWNGDFATARFLNGTLVSNQVRVTAGTFWVTENATADIGDVLLAVEDGLQDLIIEGTVTCERLLVGVGNSPDSLLDITGSLTVENLIFSTVETEFGSDGVVLCEISDGGMLSMASPLVCGPGEVDLNVFTGSSLTAEEFEFDSAAGTIHLDPLANITTNDASMINGAANVEGKWTIDGKLYIGGDADGAAGTATVDVAGNGGWLDVDSVTRIYPGSTLTVGQGSLLETSFLQRDGTLVWEPNSTIRLQNQQVDVEAGEQFGQTLGLYNNRTLEAKSFRARNGGLIDVWNGRLEASDFVSLGDAGFGRMLIDGSNAGGPSEAVIDGIIYVGGSIFGSSGTGVVDLVDGGTLEGRDTMWIYDGGAVDVNTGGVGSVATLFIIGGMLDESSAFAVGDDGFAMGQPGFVADGSTSGDVYVQAGAQVTTSSVGIGILSAGRGTVSLTGSGTAWMNSGDVTIGGGAEGTLGLSDAATFTSTGNVSIFVNGTLSFNGSAELTTPMVLNSGRVEGAGRLRGSLFNSDVLAPDTILLKDGASLTLEDAGTLEIDLAGPASSQFGSVQTENGGISVDGTLRITRSNGFVPTIGQTFEIATITGFIGTVTGEFDVIDGGDDQYAVTYLDDAILLDVVSVACIADIDGSDSIGFADLSVLLQQWGPCTDTADCPTDFNGDGTTGFFDLSLLLNAWGSC